MANKHQIVWSLSISFFWIFNEKFGFKVSRNSSIARYSTLQLIGLESKIIFLNIKFSQSSSVFFTYPLLYTLKKLMRTFRNVSRNIPSFNSNCTEYPPGPVYFNWHAAYFRRIVSIYMYRVSPTKKICKFFYAVFGHDRFCRRSRTYKTTMCFGHHLHTFFSSRYPFKTVRVQRVSRWGNYGNGDYDLSRVRRVVSVVRRSTPHNNRDREERVETGDARTKKTKNTPTRDHKFKNYMPTRLNYRINNRMFR